MSLDTMLALLALAGSAAPVPHDPGLSSLRVTCEGSRLAVHAAFANADFCSATAFDRNNDGALDAVELASAHPALAELVRTQFVLLSAGGVAAPELLGAELAENQDIELSLAFARSGGDAELQVPFLRLLSRGHRCYAALLDDGAVIRDALLSPRALAFARPAAAPAATGFAQSGAFRVLGIDHILIGFDHLAFLLALLVGCRSWRRIVATITAFTVAHSLTLLGAATGLVRLPSLLVEATIAGSIVAVAVANLLQRPGHETPLAVGVRLRSRARLRLRGRARGPRRRRRAVGGSRAAVRLQLRRRDRATGVRARGRAVAASRCAPPERCPRRTRGVPRGRHLGLLVALRTTARLTPARSTGDEGRSPCRSPCPTSQ
ncbi:MAG TPA: HupE/UreJ family protein [Planctomycetota bacterium]|nr:HupE/UreJ family protein [Planctomycetota bacterium]